MQKVVIDQMTSENTDWPNWLASLVDLAKASGYDLSGSEDAWFSDYQSGLTPDESMKMYPAKR